MTQRTPLKIGEKTPTGSVIQQILGQSKNVIVYISDNDELCWHYFAKDENLSSTQQEFVAQFDVIMNEIKSFIPPKYQYTQYALLGKSLYRALNDDEINDEKDYFKAIRASTVALANQNARVRYLIFCGIALMSSIFFLLVAFQTISLNEIWKPVLYGGIFGAIGAFVSVMHRLKTFDIEWKSTYYAVATEAAARILAGLFFGMFLIMASKSNLALGTFKDNYLALYVFATVSGFSERFVPKLIEHLQSNSDS